MVQTYKSAGISSNGKKVQISVVLLYSLLVLMSVITNNIEFLMIFEVLTVRAVNI